MTKNNRRAYKHPRATCVAIDVVYFLRQHLARHDELVPEHGVAELLAPFFIFEYFLFFNIYSYYYLFLFIADSALVGQHYLVVDRSGATCCPAK